MTAARSASDGKEEVLNRAADVHWSAVRQTRARRRRQRLARAPVRAIDVLLSALEEVLVTDQDVSPERLAAWKRSVERWVVDGGVPESIGAAHSAFALHEALLDWQGDLLGRLGPQWRSVA